MKTKTKNDFSVQLDSFADSLIEALKLVSATDKVTWRLEVSEDEWGSYNLVVVCSFNRVAMDGIPLVYRYSFSRVLTKRILLDMIESGEPMYIAKQCWEILQAKAIGDLIG